MGNRARPPASPPRPEDRDVLAEAQEILTRSVEEGSPDRGQVFLKLAGAATSEEARALLAAIGRGGALEKPFTSLATATRAKAAITLEGKAQSSAAESRSTSTKMTSDPLVENRGVSAPLTLKRGTDDPLGTKRAVLPRDAHDDPVARQSTLRPKHAQSRAARSIDDEDGWRVIVEYASTQAKAELQALLEEVRLTPRLVRKFSWGEIQTYLALSLRKARARPTDGRDFDVQGDIGPYGLRRALDTATGMILLRQKGLAIGHAGVAWKEASLDVEFNAKFSPTHPMSAEIKHSRLMTHIERLPPFDIAMDFEVTWIVEVLPTSEEIQRRLGQVIYKAQRFFEERGRPLIQRGRDAIRSSVRRLSGAGRWAGRALFRSAQASGRAARALWRGVVAAARYLPAALTGLEAALATVDLLAYLGMIAMENDRKRAESWFWRGFIRMYHSSAFDPLGRKGIESQVEQTFYMNTLSGVDLGVRLSDDEVKRWVASGSVSRNKIHLNELDWPVAFDNARRLYSEAWKLPIGGRGAVVRDALEQTLDVCGAAAALQELLAFIATQTFDYYDSNAPDAKLLERDGFEAWEHLAEGYRQYITALAEQHGVSVPEDIELASTSRLVVPIYKRMNGFPMLPG